MDNRSLSVTDYRKEEDYAPDKNDPFLYRKNNEKSRSIYTLGSFLNICRTFCWGVQYAFCVLSASGDNVSDTESVDNPVASRASASALNNDGSSTTPLPIIFTLSP